MRPWISRIANAADDADADEADADEADDSGADEAGKMVGAVVEDAAVHADVVETHAAFPSLDTRAHNV